MADSTGTDQAPPEVTKDTFRKKVWEYLEVENKENNIYPRPVNKRIPNFKGAEEAAVKAAELDAFKHAQTVKINPDKPQQHSRYLTIEGQKTLLVPTPRLRTGLFNKIVPPEELTKDVLRKCSTSQGVREHSVPIGLDANIKIDLVIVGSVAVSRSGLRIGKGEGFADLEYAMMMTMGAITPQTLVVSTVHDYQVMDVPESLMGEHDLNIDYIVTPTEVIETKRTRQQPKGIIWSMLTEEKLTRVPILNKLRLIEFRAGKDVRIKDEENAPELAALEEADKKVDELAAKEADEPPVPRYRRGRFYRNRPRSGGARGNRNRRRQTDGEDGDAEADGEKGSASESDSQKKAQRPRRQRRPRRRTNSARKDGEEGSKGATGEGETEGSGDENQQKGDRKRPYRRRWRRRGPRKPSESGDDKENAGGDHQGDTDGAAGDRGDKPRMRRRRMKPTSKLYVGNIPRSVRVSEFKAKIRGRDIFPVRIQWNGNNKYCFLDFDEYADLERALETLADMEIEDTHQNQSVKLNFQVSNYTRDRQAKLANAAGGASEAQEAAPAADADE